MGDRRARGAFVQRKAVRVLEASLPFPERARAGLRVLWQWVAVVWLGVVRSAVREVVGCVEVASRLWTMDDVLRLFRVVAWSELLVMNLLAVLGVAWHGVPAVAAARRGRWRIDSR